MDTGANYSSWIDIRSSALRHNLDQLEKIVGPVRDAQSRTLGLVVKGNAYGHGLREIVELSKGHAAVGYYFVASLAEGLFVASLGVTQSICALVPADTLYMREAIAAGIELVCSDETFLLLVAREARAVGKRARVHLKIDTGLCRFGAESAERAIFLAHYIKQQGDALELWGVMSHLADAVSPTLDFTQAQKESFAQICSGLKTAGFCWKHTHLCASGSIDFADEHSLVRVGTALYGYWKSSSQRERYALRGWGGDLYPVLEWKSYVFYLKRVPAGSSVGYGRSVYTRRDTVLAVIPVGYADGYPRALSNNGAVVIRGMNAPVMGRVSMNVMTVDVTDVPGVSLGDEVVLLGDVPGVTADDLAHQSDTVNLDVLCGLGSHIIRQVV